jgi:hypothetical protein
MLSKRILSFRKEEIQYLCMEDQKCDCYFAHEGTQSTGMMQFFRKAIEEGDRQKMHNEWLSMVKDFKNRKLTHKSDRMPAMAGLAVKFQELWPKAKYLHGIWSNDLLDGLAWSNHLVQTAEPNLCYPSWSWASVEGQTTFERRRQNEYVTQVSDDAVALTAFLHKGFAPRSESRDQYIQLHGQLKPILFRYDPEKCRGEIDPMPSAALPTDQSGRKRFWQAEIDCALEISKETGSEDTHPVLSRVPWKENHTTAFQCTVYCLRLSTDQTRGNTPMSLCLLLTRTGRMDLPLANFIFPVKGEVPGSLTEILKPKGVPVLRRIGFVLVDALKTWEGVGKRCVFIV